MISTSSKEGIAILYTLSLLNVGFPTFVNTPRFNFHYILKINDRQPRGFDLNYAVRRLVACLDTFRCHQRLMPHTSRRQSTTKRYVVTVKVTVRFNKVTFGYMSRGSLRFTTNGVLKESETFNEFSNKFRAIHSRRRFAYPQAFSDKSHFLKHFAMVRCEYW